MRDYLKLFALLIEAVKELKTENDSLKQRIEVFEEKLNCHKIIFLAYFSYVFYYLVNRNRKRNNGYK